MAEPTVDLDAGARALCGELGIDFDKLPEQATYLERKSQPNAPAVDKQEARVIVQIVVDAVLAPALEAVRRETLEECASKLVDRFEHSDYVLYARDCGLSDDNIAAVRGAMGALARAIRALAPQPRDPNPALAQERTDG